MILPKNPIPLQITYHANITMSPFLKKEVLVFKRLIEIELKQPRIRQLRTIVSRTTPDMKGSSGSFTAKLP